ncbi:hypothetical protein BAE44_0006668 [Dichanthelium oligosanthes]|uniref:Uncharacterized protein n=1 Tax=Dichanthelium oligosanthes TaxID=888268 RepID=A0A1E5W4F8_9POAL|nr:hypothetical protein BAE44_0006668 [Dichanthelium oligosanthes]
MIRVKQGRVVGGKEGPANPVTKKAAGEHRARRRRSSSATCGRARGASTGRRSGPDAVAPASGSAPSTPPRTPPGRTTRRPSGCKAPVAAYDAAAIRLQGAGALPSPTLPGPNPPALPATPTPTPTHPAARASSCFHGSAASPVSILQPQDTASQALWQHHLPARRG